MSKFTQFWVSIGQWIRRHPRWSLVLFGVTLIISAGVTAYSLLSQPTTELPSSNHVTKKQPEPPPPPPTYYAPLTGVKIDSESLTTAPVTAIMLENSPSARPQSGIKQAEVVFEAIAEGGITRFLAIYQQEKPQLIGPVRSVRMYYIDWAAPFDASIAHIGGSYYALQEIRNGSYRDIDQFFNPSAYWRASDRYPPHNVYTSFEKLDALNAKKGYTSSNPKTFARKDSAKAEVVTANTVNVTISSSLYNSSYTYNPTSNTYDRSQGGAPHTDREQGQISPRVVVVMRVPMNKVFEDGWRMDYQTVGSGTAHIFQDGVVQEVTWHKDDKKSQIYFTGENNTPVELARGQTWITTVPQATGGVSWQ